MADARPRLLVVTSTYPRWTGDDEPTFVHELCKRLVEWFEVRVVTSHAAGAKSREVIDSVAIERYRYAPAALESLVYRGGIAGNLRAAPWKALLLPPYCIGMALSIRRQRRRWRPNVVHAHWFIPAGFVAAHVIGRACPLVVTAHGSDVFALRGYLWRAFRRFVARTAASLTAVGIQLAHEIEAESGCLVEVLPMGVDMGGVFTAPQRNTRTDHMLFVGRLVAEKRPDLALHVLAGLQYEFPELKLVLAGDGPLRTHLEAQSQALGIAHRVVFLGRLAHGQLAEHYKSACVTLVTSGDPSAPEGLGLASIEALACGCPVVSQPNPTLRTAIPPSAPIAFAKDESVTSFVEALRGVLGATARHPVVADCGDSWREALVERFDWDAVAARHARHLLAAARIH